MNEKIIFDDSAGQVEDRNGVSVCAFKTASGQEVLFFRDKNDNVIKSFEGQLDSVDFAKARGIAGLALPRKFLKKEPRSTTKIVSASTFSPKPPSTARGAKPRWLRADLARVHANQISPHVDED